MRHLKIAQFLYFVLGFILWVSILKAQEELTIFNEAQELKIKREWDKALEKYELIKIKYPDSKYVDDAEFWSAYILEQQGKDSEAFGVYQEMIQRYPESPWVDDATIHQIGLAEKFVRDGWGDYSDFLTDKLESPYKSVKYQAALSLGKLGDERAMSALKEMANNGDRDMRSMANSLLEKNFNQKPPKDRHQIRPMPDIQSKTRTDKRDDGVRQPKTKPERQQYRPSRKPDVKIIRPTPKQQPQRSTPPKKKGKISQSFYESKRYKIYKSLALKTHRWTEQDLISYSLRHLLSEDKFHVDFLVHRYYSNILGCMFYSSSEQFITVNV